ncbi:MAG: Fic family protein, partial [Methanomicrobiales archaeon]|nr:Fic family protein [Methanomicrobiales archaeon]
MESYTPLSLPPQNIDWTRLMPFIARANDAIARYQWTLVGIANPLVLLSLMNTHEAIRSSRIDGIQVSLDDVLNFESDPRREVIPEMGDGIQLIINYRAALQKAVEEPKRPLSIELVRDLHRVLFTNVTGKDREPGEIRKTQSHITPPGSPIREEVFIPPEPGMILDALTDWERYFHRVEKDHLVQLALLKAQFELIRPFPDGNGRIGRMLVPLILFHKDKIPSPVFPISPYLERHRDEYFAALLDISHKDDWNNWIAFFLQALSEQAEENMRKAKGIHALYQEVETAFPRVTRARYAPQVIASLFTHPQFQLSDFLRHSGVPKGSAKRILHILRQKGFLEVVREARGKLP